MSVVGIDFGNESCVIAVAKNRGIDVLQNEVGHRATPSLVAFSSEQRLLGNDAVPQYMSNAKNTVKYMKRLLGLKLDAPDLKAELPHISYRVENNDDNALCVNIKYDGKQEKMLPEQICGAMFQKIKAIAERGLGAQVVDCVIGVPPYWTDVQRRSLLESATVAGLRPLRLMNETTAVALNYGILRPIEEARTVLFVDVGQCSTTATIVDFEKGKLTVKATASDRHCGGRDFDKALFDHFAAYVKDTYKLDVHTNVKATLKLYKECGRIKKILSANSHVPMTVEYLMNDVDVKGKITRDEFEKLVQPVLERILGPIRKVLESSAVSQDSLFAIEIVGGAIRIPCVQALLKDFFQKDMSKTCDGDESVARGCALQCAMLSPAFRVKDFEVRDINPFPIEVSWGPVPTGDGKMDADNTNTLFGVNNPIPSVKMISFMDRTQPFQLVAKYGDSADLPEHVDPLIGRFVVSGMPSSTDMKKCPKIKVKVKLNLHGILDVHSAQLMLQTAEEPKADVPAAEVEAMDAKPDMDTSADPAGEVPKTESPKPDDSPKEKKKKKRVPLQVVKHVAGLTQQQHQALEERETAMFAQDKAIEETALARNTLESYVLEMRNKLGDELKEFVLEPDSEAFTTTLTETEDWLYDECGAQKSEYKTKLAEMRKIGDPIEKRRRESEGRPEAVAYLEQVVREWRAFAATEEAAYKHIGPDDRQKIVDECAVVEAWLAEQKLNQDKLNKSDDPTLTCALLKSKAKGLANFSKPIMSKPKPKPKKKEKKADKDPKADNATEGSAPADKVDEPADKVDEPTASDNVAEAADTEKETIAEADASPAGDLPQDTSASVEDVKPETEPAAMDEST